ncbi:hypothetical protein C2138_00815 [Salinibacterium hongtaonis]|nr:hypothetical protein C2138_00815 [Salinibacterium hongtaonis]
MGVALLDPALVCSGESKLLMRHVADRSRRCRASRRPSRPSTWSSSSASDATGRIAMHSASPFADDVYIRIGSGVTLGDHRAAFAVAVDSPGVRLMARKISARHENPFLAPLSSRFDELDAQMWLENVVVPWDRVFPTASAASPPAARPDQVTWAWTNWHQLYCLYAKGEFSLGLALALTDIMGQKGNPKTREHLTDMMVELEAVRSALVASELDPDWSSPTGIPSPNLRHLAAGSLRMMQNQRKLNEILRIIPGSSMVTAPSDAELADPVLAGLEQSFGGGCYTALQRSAVLHLAWDHVSSALDARESAFELHANRGAGLWRTKTERSFPIATVS